MLMKARLNTVAKTPNVIHITGRETHGSARRLKVVTVANHAAAHRNLLVQGNARLWIYPINIHHRGPNDAHRLLHGVI